jgi:hypothetical protein
MHNTVIAFVHITRFFPEANEQIAPLESLNLGSTHQNSSDEFNLTLNGF